MNDILGYKKKADPAESRKEVDQQRRSVNIKLYEGHYT